jgi:hypothetical protein
MIGNEDPGRYEAILPDADGVADFNLRPSPDERILSDAETRLRATHLKPHKGFKYTAYSHLNIPRHLDLRTASEKALWTDPAPALKTHDMDPHARRNNPHKILNSIYLSYQDNEPFLGKLNNFS